MLGYICRNGTERNGTEVAAYLDYLYCIRILAYPAPQDINLLAYNCSRAVAAIDKHACALMKFCSTYISQPCLLALASYRNPLSSKSIISIARCLKVNSTLELLWLPRCPQGIQEEVRAPLQDINRIRQSQQCQGKKLEIKFSVY